MTDFRSASKTGICNYLQEPELELTLFTTISSIFTQFLWKKQHQTPKNTRKKSRSQGKGTSNLKPISCSLAQAAVKKARLHIILKHWILCKATNPNLISVRNVIPSLFLYFKLRKSIKGKMKNKKQIHTFSKSEFKNFVFYHTSSVLWHIFS